MKRISQHPLLILFIASVFAGLTLAHVLAQSAPDIDAPVSPTFSALEIGGSWVSDDGVLFSISSNPMATFGVQAVIGAGSLAQSIGAYGTSQNNIGIVSEVATTAARGEGDAYGVYATGEIAGIVANSSSVGTHVNNAVEADGDDMGILGYGAQSGVKVSDATGRVSALGYEKNSANYGLYTDGKIVLDGSLVSSGTVNVSNNIILPSMDVYGATDINSLSIGAWKSSQTDVISWEADSVNFALDVSNPYYFIIGNADSETFPLSIDGDFTVGQAGISSVSEFELSPGLEVKKSLHSEGKITANEIGSFYVKEGGPTASTATATCNGGDEMVGCTGVVYEGNGALRQAGSVQSGNCTVSATDSSTKVLAYAYCFDPEGTGTSGTLTALPNSDTDSWVDFQDNCPSETNEDQTDNDQDGYGSVCDCNDSSASVYPGTTASCGTNTGECVAGTTTCQSSGSWESCQGSVGATSEICDGSDNDCDGQTDEGGVCSECTQGQTQTCGSTTTNAGACNMGTETCDSSGNWGSCVGEVGPSTETCDGTDQDCDGTTDANENLTTPSDCDQDGYCAGSFKTCTGSSYGSCNKTAQVENCADNVDNDCDGTVNEDCSSPCTATTWYKDVDNDGYGDPNIPETVCIHSSGFVNNKDDCNDNDDETDIWASSSCSTGLYGVCAAGTKTCSYGVWGTTCTQTTAVSTENCNDSKDNDCDNFTDCSDSYCSSNSSCVNAPPTGTIFINSNDIYTTNRSVTLTLSCSDSDGCSKMRFSANNSSWSSEEKYFTSKSYTLSSGDGTKYVYVQFKDNAGIWSDDPFDIYDAITLDSTGPTGTIKIDADAPYTTDTSVILTLTCTVTNDCSQMKFMRLSADGTGDDNFGAAENYSSTKSNYSLLSADGLQYVYVQFKDTLGNWGASSSDSITVDRTPPNAPTVKVSPTYPDPDTTPTWSWTSGGGGGNANYRYELDNSDLSTGAISTISTGFTSSSLSTGNHTLYVQERDAAGNWSASGSKAITIESPCSVPGTPSPSVSRVTTGNGGYKFSWSAVSGATAYYYYLTDETGAVVYGTNDSKSTTGTSVTITYDLYHFTFDTSNDSYTFYVAAYNSCGKGDYGSVTFRHPIVADPDCVDTANCAWVDKLLVEVVTGTREPWHWWVNRGDIPCTINCGGVRATDCGGTGGYCPDNIPTTTSLVDVLTHTNSLLKGWDGEDVTGDMTSFVGAYLVTEGIITGTDVGNISDASIANAINGILDTLGYFETQAGNTYTSDFNTQATITGKTLIQTGGY